MSRGQTVETNQFLWSLNGRAANLVRPEYPTSATYVGVRGAVQVSVQIDQRGCVVEATALRGHPFLIPASVRAAKRSTFFPVLVGGKPVRVYGVIVYNYSMDQMNWLELGYWADDYQVLSEHIPTRFKTEIDLLKKSKEGLFDEKQNVQSSVVKSIALQLQPESRNLWLFSLGQTIKELSKTSWNPERRDTLLKVISEMLKKAPANVSPNLTSALRNLTEQDSPIKINDQISAMTERLYFFGN